MSRRGPETDHNLLRDADAAAYDAWQDAVEAECAAETALSVAQNILRQAQANTLRTKAQARQADDKYAAARRLAARQEGA